MTLMSLIPRDIAEYKANRLTGETCKQDNGSTAQVDVFKTCSEASR